MSSAATTNVQPDFSSVKTTVEGFSAVIVAAGVVARATLGAGVGLEDDSEFSTNATVSATAAAIGTANVTTERGEVAALLLPTPPRISRRRACHSNSASGTRICC